MKVCGIIAEYNPFHNGHAYQIQAARRAGATHVICVMSGNFTQRGDVAITDKLTRTRMALACGADVVLELPVSYCLAPAEGFARGAVELLMATGCVDVLHFGSECGDPEKIRAACAAVETVENKGLVEPGETTAAAARCNALRAHGYTEAATLLESPNNLLGVEYLLALRRRGSHILPETVARIGAEHDGREPNRQYCSASQLRRFLAEDFSYAETFMPPEAFALLDEQHRAGRRFITVGDLNTALLSRLRMMDPAYLARIAGVSEGLENRLYQAIRQGRSFEEICTAVKTKRYPLSRIRRSLLCAAIGITAADAAAPPAYLRILGQTQAGNEVLRRMSATAKLPMAARGSDLEQIGPAGKRSFGLENAATDLYAMGYDPIDPCGTEWTRNIYSYTKGNAR